MGAIWLEALVVLICFGGGGRGGMFPFCTVYVDGSFVEFLFRAAYALIVPDRCGLGSGGNRFVVETSAWRYLF